MKLLNISFFVQRAIETEWLEWLTQVHLSTVTGGLHVDKRFFSIVSDQEDAGYALQFTFKSREDLERFYSEELDKFFFAISQKYGEKVLNFVSVMEEINLSR